MEVYRLEEKKAIKNIKKEFEKNHILPDIANEDLGTLLNLIEKQSKEIEELKDKCKELIFEKQELTSALLDSTPDDKIKAKIEELDKEEKEALKGTKGQDRYAIKQEYMYKRSGLQSLLEKE